MNAAVQVAQDWQPVLELSSTEVFSIMLNAKLHPAISQLLAPPECTAIVGLAGSLRGVLTLRCGGETAKLLAANMLQLPPAEASRYGADALGEVANMIAGNFKNKIDGVTDRCLLSAPTVIVGMNYSCHSLASAPPVELWFQFEDQPLQVTMQVRM